MKSEEMLATLTNFCRRHGIQPEREQKGKPGEFRVLAIQNSKNLISAWLGCLRRREIPILAPQFGVPPPETFMRAECLALAREARNGRMLFGAFTSGSTGSANFHLFDLAAAFQNAEWHAESLGICSDTTIVQALPLGHIFGLIAYLLAPAIRDAEVIFGNAPSAWVYNFPNENRKAILHLIPDQLRAFERSDWSSREALVSVGAGYAPKIMLDRLNRGPAHIFTTYGLTEAGPRVASGAWSGDRPAGWFGQVFSGIATKLETTKCSDYPELKLKTPCASLLAEFDEEGYLATGDLVEALDDGTLIFRGRYRAGFKFRGRLYTSADFQMLKTKAGLTGTALVVHPAGTTEFRIFLDSSDAEPAWREIFAQLLLPIPGITVMPRLPLDAMGKLNFENALTDFGLANGVFHTLLL